MVASPATTHLFHFDNSYGQLPSAFYAFVPPAPVANPRLLQYNHSLAGQLGLANLSMEEAARVFTGNSAIAGSEPLALAYAGHQFGAPTMLGDGRAILLGEQLTPAGDRFDIQLKGGGPTPFSRRGDGRGTLSSMLREYLLSEAMAALGVTTTRSLAATASGETVMRELPQPGGVLTRVARSHLRVGSFQYAAWHSDKTLLPALFDYTRWRHYPSVENAGNPALALLEAVMTRQLSLVVSWMRVGFIHGVMNTDNVSIAGETLDYGPCAFMDTYHPNTVFSSIDMNGRYAFGQQPMICQWNLERLAETLLPLIDDDTDKAIAMATEYLQDFMPRFGEQWQQMMRQKLGLCDVKPGDAELITDWLQLLKDQQLDYTNAHRALMGDALPENSVYQTQAFRQWHERWKKRGGGEGDAAKALMEANNPAVIPRNHLVNQALEQAEQGDMSAFDQLREQLSRPYDARTSDTLYCQPPTPAEKVQQTFCGT